MIGRPTEQTQARYLRDRRVEVRRNDHAVNLLRAKRPADVLDGFEQLGRLALRERPAARGRDAYPHRFQYQESERERDPGKLEQHELLRHDEEHRYADDGSKRSAKRGHEHTDAKQSERRDAEQILSWRADGERLEANDETLVFDDGFHLAWQSSASGRALEGGPPAARGAFPARTRIRAAPRGAARAAPA